ncbi:MAG: hypothetical protein J6X89_02735 [Bacteroidales bacterium]|nr:hypothetical protein [Bacteroidales bacterium]
MRRILIVLLAAVALTSCATARYYSEFSPAAAANEMVLLEPVATHFYMDENDREQYSDSLTVVAESRMVDAANQLGLPVNCMMELDDAQRNEAIAFMQYLISRDNAAKGEVPIPGILDDMLESSGYRYGLILFEDGMNRDKGSYIRDAVIGLTVGIFLAVVTMGLFTTYLYPMSAISTTHAAILDSVTDKVVYYNYEQIEALDPLKPAYVTKQVREVMEDFLK